MIKRKGYHYLCVSRTRLKDYEMVQHRLTVLLETKSKQEVRLKSVRSDKHHDYFLEVRSECKAQTQISMNKQFGDRFEIELLKIKNALHRKGGIKQIDKVHERIGRAKQKYPSVSALYNIEVLSAEEGIANDLKWEIDESKLQDKESGLGIYFLRTDLD